MVILLVMHKPRGKSVTPMGKFSSRVRTPIISLAFVLSLVLSMVVFYAVVEESTGVGIPGEHIPLRGSLHVSALNRTYTGVVFRRGLEFGVECYALLGKYDKIEFDAKLGVTNASYEWGIFVEVENTVTEEVFKYVEVYHIARSPKPEFYAPRSSLYRVKYVVFVNFTEFHGDIVDYEVEYLLSGKQYRRLDFYSNAPIVVAVLLVITLLLVLVGGRLGFMEKLAYTGFTGLVRYELRSMWLFTLIPVNAVLYAFLVTRFNTEIAGVTAILSPVAMRRIPDYILVYTVVTAISTVVLFAYKWENKHERSMDLIPKTRLARYFAKLVAVLAETMVPVALTSLLLYITWQPDVVFGRADIFLPAYMSHVLYFLLVTLFVFSLASTISTILPYTSASLLTTVTLIFLLYIRNPLAELLRTDLAFNLYLMYPSSTCVLHLHTPSSITSVPRYLLYIPYDTARTILILSLFLLLVSMAIYSLRENP